MKTLLLEVGAEEIPTGYIEPALDALSAKLLEKLDGLRIAHGAAKVFGTPRRLAVMVEAVADKQEPLTSEVTGPPEKVAFDGDGNPTVAAVKFAEKNKIDVKDLNIKETKKGRYLCATVSDQGRPAIDLLEKVFPEVIKAIPFPKTMKWADLKMHFARPVHSLLAMLGEDVVPFTLWNIESGQSTWGHSFTHPKQYRLSSPDEYVKTLKDAGVVPGVDERRDIIRLRVEKLAVEMGGSLLADDELIGINANLVENPLPSAGKFEDKYLEVPKEVLVTAMREHQKYFSVVDDSENLLPYFIAVNNTAVKDMDLVTAGHERVLRARLDDARFFYMADLEDSMEDWTQRLKNVLFQARLGSIFEKAERVAKLAEFIAQEIGADGDEMQRIVRAGQLFKADLESQVVCEFPKLQGVMGRIYALKAGEDAEVAAAIEEHYRPLYSGGTLPETRTGAVLSVAEKIDSICGCFSVGLIPTGASDPYALRRQGIGLALIMLDKQFGFSLNKAIAKSLELLKDKATADMAETASKAIGFIQGRIEHILIEEGFSKDVVASIAAVSVDNAPDVWNRTWALENMKSKPDFEPLAAAFKRVVNIIRKSAKNEDIDGLGLADEGLFEQGEEKELVAALRNVKTGVDNDLENGSYDDALLKIASLRGAVDAFFDNVLVMAEDEKVKRNRLAILKEIWGLFAEFADFSRIST